MMITQIYDEKDQTEKGKLKRIKANVENSYQYWKPNYDRYTKFRNFVFVSAMDSGAKSINRELERNNLECNVVEAYVNRLCGEFSQNEPTLMISAADDMMYDNPQQHAMEAEKIRVYEGYIRHIIQETKKNGLEYEVYRDLLSGGYCSVKVMTDYINDRSFTQEIKFQKTFDQTLVGWDPLAMDKDKSDGKYCFEIVPMLRQDFEDEFPNVDLQKVKFARSDVSLCLFNWSYNSGDAQIVMIGDYYEKVKDNVTIVQLSDGQTMEKKEYKKFIEKWNEEFYLHIDEQAPIIVRERKSLKTKIMRYQLIETEVILEEETDYPSLPIKFFDCNSIANREGDSNGAFHLMTRPCIYQAEGAQRLKNYALQSLANELENMRPQQVIASLESIPKDYLDGYRKPQNTTALIYNAFHEGNVNVPLSPPMIAPRNPIPQEITNTFMGADAVIQNVLGAFDASMQQLTEQQMSGKAYEQLATMGNTAAIPGIRNYMQGLQSICQMAIDMAPMYLKSRKLLPVVLPDGSKDMVPINQEGGVNFDYEPGAYRVKIEPGVSFALQQTQALTQVISLANAIPKIGEFVNAECMDLIWDNVHIRNKDTWSSRAEGWMQQQKQMQQQAMQMANQQPKMEQMALQVAQQQVQAEHQAAMAKVQVQSRDSELKSVAKAAEIELDKQRLYVEMAKVEADMLINEQKLGIEQQKADDERVNTVIDAAIKQSGHTHDLAHKAFEREIKGLEMDRNHELAFKGLETKAEERAEREINKE